MREPGTLTASVVRCTTPACFGRFCQYDNDSIPARRASPSRLYEARGRVSFPCGHALRLLHKPPVQIVCANRIGIGVACVYSQASGSQACKLSRVPVGLTCLSPFRPEGIPGHRTRESANAQKARTGVREDAVGRLGLRSRAPAISLSRNGGGEGRVL